MSTFTIKELKAWLKNCDELIAIPKKIIYPLINHYTDLRREKMKKEQTK